MCRSVAVGGGHLLTFRACVRCVSVKRRSADICATIAVVGQRDRELLERRQLAQQRTTAMTASSRTVVAWPGGEVSSRKNASPGPHDLVSSAAVVSPRPAKTNIHCRAGAGCAGSVQPAGNRMNIISRTGTAAETSRGGAGGANAAPTNETSRSSNRDWPAVSLWRRIYRIGGVCHCGSNLGVTGECSRNP